uniref:Nuclear transport factor 2 family protein n=1 Tax=Agrobacterium rosae TaxID=1972867 RepID=A0ABU4VZ98_9HYPH|nr:nuclear transport factor 2 family protein [Agrobacterium rosae]MDX8315150.1 nuclear transport factor 2 family protein [Agrobacterium rosae]MDX8330832.1 nuclear transport factor 2 family protein [Agrobacterium rosae]
MMDEHGLSTWRFIGTTTTGQTVDVDGCDVFTFSGDLIALKDSYRKNRT